MIKYSVENLKNDAKFMESVKVAKAVKCDKAVESCKK